MTLLNLISQMKNLSHSLRIVALTALGALSSTGIHAYDFEAGGLYYNITDEKHVELTYNNEKHDAGVGSYSGTVEIPEFVTNGNDGKEYLVIGIGNEAFRFSNDLESISYPLIEYIGASAFEGCAKVPLAPIYFPDTDENLYCSLPHGVKWVYDRAFANSGLEEVYCSDAYFYPEAFKDCKKLKKAIMEVPRIPDECFAGCTALEEVQTGEMTTDICTRAFAGCTSLRSSYLLMVFGLESIYSHVFDGCSALDFIYIPASVFSIDENAFNGCTGLTSVVFSGVQLYSNGDNKLAFSNLKIGADSNIFNGCNSITSSTLGRRVVSDYEGTALVDPFRGLPLTSIRFEDFALETAFNGADYPALESVASATMIPPKVAGFTQQQYNNVNLYHLNAASSAYYNDPIWGKFTKGGSTNTAGVLVVEYDGLYYATYNYSEEATVVRNPYGTAYKGAYTVSGFQLDDSMRTPTVIGECAFMDNSEVTEVNLPSSILKVKGGAFSGTGIKSINISECELLETNAFYGCHNLEEVILSDKLNTIPSYAFSHCDKLSRINLPQQPYLIIEKNAFDGCKSLPRSLEFPGVECLKLGESTFSDCSITDLTLPRLALFENNYASYGDFPFMGNPLKNVTVSNLTTVTPLLSNLQTDGHKDVETLTVKGDITISSTDGYSWDNTCWLTDGKINRLILDLSEAYDGSAGWLNESWNVNIIESRQQTPPTIGNFSEAQYQTIKVYVPTDALDAYKAAPVWKEFVNIEGIDFGGLSDVKADTGISCNAVAGGINLAAPNHTHYNVYSPDGSIITSGMIESSPIFIPISSGTYIVRIGTTPFKLQVR